MVRQSFYEWPSEWTAASCPGESISAVPRAVDAELGLGVRPLHRPLCSSLVGSRSVHGVDT